MILRLESSPSFTDQAAFFILYNIIGKLVPMAIISYCYLKVYQELKNPVYHYQGGSKGRRSRVLWYCIIPLICFVPSIVTDVIISMAVDNDRANYISDNGGIWIYTFEDLPIRLWGLLNLMNYWFFMPSSTTNRLQNTELSVISMDINSSI